MSNVQNDSLRFLFFILRTPRYLENGTGEVKNMIWRGTFIDMTINLTSSPSKIKDSQASKDNPDIHLEEKA